MENGTMNELLVSLLACVTAAAAFAILYGVVKDPERRAGLWSAGRYLAYVQGTVLFVGIWLTSSRRIAALFEGRTSEQADQIRLYLNGALYAILATAGLVLAIRLLRRLRGAFVRRIRLWAAIGKPIRFRGLDLISRERVRDSAVVVARAANAVAILFLLYVYVPLVLSFFPITAAYGGQLFQYISRPATEIGLAVIGYVPKLVYLAVIVVVVRYALKLLRFFSKAVGRGDLAIRGFDSDWAEPTYKLLRALAIIFTLMIGFPYLPGAQSEFFRGFSLFVGALVTLGSTAAVGNMVSGVILTYTRAFRVGDRVAIGDAVGDVLSKSLFVTRLRTIYNEEITIPNGLVLSGKVVNYSNAAKRQELILKVEVGLGYDVHWSRTDELLKSAASEVPAVLKEPPPFVWPKALENFAVIHELHAYTDRADSMGETHAALRRAVLDRLHGAGVEIMTPDVHSLRDGSRTAIPSKDASGGTPGGPGIRVDIAGGARPAGA